MQVSVNQTSYDIWLYDHSGESVEKKINAATKKKNVNSRKFLVLQIKLILNYNWKNFFKVIGRMFFILTI